MTARIDHLVTSGTFALDGGEWDVDNNVWIIGDDTEAIVIDAAHDAAAIEAALNGRTLRAIVCTHAHNDHIDAAPALAGATGAPVLLHPDDLPLWKQTHPDRLPDGELADGQELEIAGDDPAGPAHPRSRPGRRLPVRPRAVHGLHRGHALPGRTRRHRTVLLPLPDHRRVDPGPAAHPPAGDHRPHRTRRLHHHRRGGPAARRVDRPRSLRTGDPHRSGHAESRSPLSKRRGSPVTGSVNSSTRARSWSGREKSSGAPSASTTG